MEKMKLSALGLVIAAASASQAAIIASYEFTGGTRASNDTETNSTADELTVGAGISSSGVNNGVLRVPTNQTDGSFALSENDYLEFTITPHEGKKLELASFTVDVGDSGNPNDTVFRLRSDLDAYAADINGTFSANTDNTLVARSVSLAGASFQGLATATTFRLYFNDGANASSSNYTLFDNLRVSGDVVPEPASLSVLGLGAVGLLRRRRMV